MKKGLTMETSNIRDPVDFSEIFVVCLDDLYLKHAASAKKKSLTTDIASDLVDVYLNSSMIGVLTPRWNETFIETYKGKWYYNFLIELGEIYSIRLASLGYNLTELIDSISKNLTGDKTGHQPGKDNSRYCLDPANAATRFIREGEVRNALTENKYLLMHILFVSFGTKTVVIPTTFEKTL